MGFGVVFFAENGGESGEGEVLVWFLGGRVIVEAFEVIVEGVVSGGARAGRVAVREEGEVGGEGGVGVVGATAGGVTGGGGGGGGGGGAGGGEEERADHGDALGEVQREELALVEQLIRRAQCCGRFSRRN